MPLRLSPETAGLVKVVPGKPLTAEDRRVLTEHVKHLKRVLANPPVTFTTTKKGGAKTAKKAKAKK